MRVRCVVACYVVAVLNRMVEGLLLGHNDRPSRAAKLGVQDLANLHASPACQEAIEGANLTNWQRSQTEEHSDQQSLVSRDLNLIYIRNQKVASTLLYHNLDDFFGSRFEECWVHLGLFQEVRHSAWKVITVVRDPIETAVAAYVEVDRRHEKYAANEPFKAMPCGTKAEATARFKSYLKSLRDGHRIGKALFHSYPQALKTNAEHPGRLMLFDAIGKLENLYGDIKEMHQMMGISHKVPEEMRYPSRGSTEDEACGNVDLSDKELVNALCDMYHVDYVCFNYEKPPLCSQ